MTHNWLHPAACMLTSSCMHVALYSVPPRCTLILAGCSVTSLPRDRLHGDRSTSDHWCYCKQAWPSIHKIIACSTELLLHQHCSSIDYNQLVCLSCLGTPWHMLGIAMAVPSKTHCCNFESIPMVTVLYAGIQDTLNLIMI